MLNNINFYYYGKGSINANGINGGEREGRKEEREGEGRGIFPAQRTAQRLHSAALSLCSAVCTLGNPEQVIWLPCVSK